MPPQIVVRAADFRPYELQDLLPSDTRFKLLLFTGDISNTAQQIKLQRLADETEKLLQRYTPGMIYDIFDVISISSATKEKVIYTDVPLFFRPHWSKCVFHVPSSLNKPADYYPECLSKDPT